MHGAERVKCFYPYVMSGQSPNSRTLSDYALGYLTHFGPMFRFSNSGNQKNQRFSVIETERRPEMG